MVKDVSGGKPLTSSKLRSPIILKGDVEKESLEEVLKPSASNSTFW